MEGLPDGVTWTLRPGGEKEPGVEGTQDRQRSQRLRWDESECHSKARKKAGLAVAW